MHALRAIRLLKHGEALLVEAKEERRRGGRWLVWDEEQKTKPERPIYREREREREVKSDVRDGRGIREMKERGGEGDARERERGRRERRETRDEREREKKEKGESKR